MINAPDKGDAVARLRYQNPDFAAVVLRGDEGWDLVLYDNQGRGMPGGTFRTGKALVRFIRM